MVILALCEVLGSIQGIYLRRNKPRDKILGRDWQCHLSRAVVSAGTNQGTKESREPETPSQTDRNPPPQHNTGELGTRCREEPGQCATGRLGASTLVSVTLLMHDDVAIFHPRIYIVSAI